MPSEPWIRVRVDGPPRAVGAAQGEAWRAARPERDETPWESLGRAARWVLRWGGRSLASPLSFEQRQRLGRDLRRHFPHFSERAEALARSAGSGPVWDAVADPQSRAFALRVHAGPAPGLGCALPAGRRWVLRDVTSDGGRRSCGVGVPWLPAQLAGVNDAGLCGVVAVGTPLFPVRRRAPGADARDDAEGRAELPAVMAPGWLLLDQCLERCDRVERALAWCERRPGGGSALLLFADAAGDRAAIAIEGTSRRVVAVETPRTAPAGSLALWLDPHTRSVELRAPDGHGVVLASADSSTASSDAAASRGAVGD